jgi:hypothetical protein
MPDLTNWVAGEAAVKSAFDTLKSAIGLPIPGPSLVRLSKTGRRAPRSARAFAVEWRGTAPSPHILRMKHIGVNWEP